MAESFKTEIVQRLFRNFLDLMVLKLINKEPMWGYRIIRHIKDEYKIRLRHSALYPLLNNLEKKGLLRSRTKTKSGRVRKIYEITSKGIQLINAYDELLQQQLENTSP